MKIPEHANMALNNILECLKSYEIMLDEFRIEFYSRRNIHNETLDMAVCQLDEVNGNLEKFIKDNGKLKMLWHVINKNESVLLGKIPPIMEISKVCKCKYKTTAKGEFPSWIKEIYCVGCGEVAIRFGDKCLKQL